MKIGLELLPGKRIKAVVFTEDRPGSRMRVFLCFEDGQSFEFYGQSFCWGSFLEDTTRILEYVESGQGQVFRAYPEPEDRESTVDSSLSPEFVRAVDETPIFVTRREMDAWVAAKAVIGKAKAA